MRLTKISKLVAAGVFIAGASAQAQVTVGVADTHNCIPLCDVGDGSNHYQQVYAASAFPAAISIDAITFFHTVFFPGTGDYAPGTYIFSLGTTSNAVGALSTTFTDNETTPLAFFASLVIPPATSAAAPSLTVQGSSFFYDPADGNLLLDISYSNSPSIFNAFFDADDRGLVTSRVVGADNTGTSRALGLVTRFDSSPVTATPEPASVTLLATGLFAVAGYARRRRQIG